MRKIIYLLGLVLLISVVFSSCEKDEDSEPRERKLIPIKITEYEDDVLEGETVFEYDENNNPVKVDYGEGYYNTLEYDSDGRLALTRVYEDNSLNSYETYEYNSYNQIIKIQYYNQAGEAGSYYVHEYDANGNVIKKTQYGTNDAVVLYYAYEHDSKGNVINTKYYWADYQSGLVSTDEYRETTYQYDDKNNIYKSVDSPFLWETNINNVLVKTFTDHYGNNYSVTYNYVYVYNDDNYPTEYTDDNERYVIEYKEI